MEKNYIIKVITFFSVKYIIAATLIVITGS